MKKAITIYSAGAAEEVTGSRHYIEYNNKKYQIDCGIFQGDADADKRNKTAELEKPDAVILTHCHADHCGLLPRLVKEGYVGKIYFEQRGQWQARGCKADSKLTDDLCITCRSQ